MTKPVSMMVPNSAPRCCKHSRSHRIDVHRHADEFLEKEAQRIALEEAKITKVKPANNVFFQYLKTLSKGLETMYGALNIKV